jgi:hypothetical protein
MTTQTDKKSRYNAIFNIIAGILFFAAAFNLLGGRGGIDWFELLAGVVFILGGIYGLMRR